MTSQYCNHVLNSVKKTSYTTIHKNMFDSFNYKNYGTKIMQYFYKRKCLPWKLSLQLVVRSLVSQHKSLKYYLTDFNWFLNCLQKWVTETKKIWTMILTLLSNRFSLENITQVFLATVPSLLKWIFLINCEWLSSVNTEVNC